MKTRCADYVNDMVRVASVLTTLIIAVTFAMVSSAKAAVPVMGAVEAIHKGNAVEAIHKVKIEAVKVEQMTTAATQKSDLKNRVNNNRIENAIFARRLFGLRGLGLDLDGLIEE